MSRTLKLPYLAESGDALTIAAKSMLVFVGSHLVLRILRTSVRPRVTLKLVPMVTVISLMWPVAAHAAEPFRLIITESVTPLVPNSVMELALEFGYFRREGVEVRLIRVDQTPLAVAWFRATAIWPTFPLSRSCILLLVVSGSGRQWSFLTSLCLS